MAVVRVTAFSAEELQRRPKFHAAHTHLRLSGAVAVETDISTLSIGSLFTGSVVGIVPLWSHFIFLFIYKCKRSEMFYVNQANTAYQNVQLN